MKNKDLEHMQVRLFRRCMQRWNLKIRECADIFDRFRIDQYIADAYEFFHVQGDEANIEEIEQFLHGKGMKLPLH